MAVTNHDHTVRGSRIMDMPSARARSVVTIRLMELTHDATQNIAMLSSQRSIPRACPGPALGSALSGGYCVHPDSGAPPLASSEATITSQETNVSQNPSAFSVGKAIRHEPICAGSRRLANAPCGAEVSTKKTIMVAWMVMYPR